MADRYWVGGTGTWDNTNTTNWSSTSGGAGGVSVPTSSDTVYFNSSSGGGTVTLGNYVNCASLIFTGFTGIFDFAGHTVYTIGNVTFSSSATYQNNSGVYALLYTNTNCLFTSNGVNLQSITPELIIKSVNGTLTLQDNLTCSGLNCSQGGSIDTNNKTVTATSIQISNGYFDAKSSQINCGTFYFWYGTLLSSNASFNVSDYFESLSSVSFANLTVGPAVSSSNYIPLYFSTSLSVTSALNIIGTSPIRVNVKGTDTTNTISAGSTSVSYADFKNVTKSGSSITGTSIGNVGNNSNITFTAAVTRYAKNAGNWNSTNTWSATDGGPSGASIPLPQDTVFCTASFPNNNTLTVNVQNVASLTCTAGFSDNRFLQLDLDEGYNFAGSLVLPSGGRVTTPGGSTYWYFYGVTASSYTIDFNTETNTFLRVYIQNGTYTIDRMYCDEFVVQGTSNITWSGSSFYAKTFSLGDTSSFTNNSSSYITVYSVPTISVGSSCTLSGSPNFKLTPNANSSITAEGKTFGDVLITQTTSGRTVTFYGSNTYKSIMYTSPYTTTLRFQPAKTTTITSGFNVVGGSGRLVTITVISANSDQFAHTLNYTGSGIIVNDYLSIGYSTATPSNKWYAGKNSTQGSKVSGWIFDTPTFGNNGLLFGSNF